MFIENNKIRWMIVLGIIGIALWWLSPNVLSKKWWMPREKLVYGLDIQGGVHLVLGVNVDEVFKNKLTRIQNSLLESFKQKGIQVVRHELNPNIYIQIEKVSDTDSALQIIQDEYGNVLQFLRSNQGIFEFKYNQIQSKLVKEEIIEQSIEVIRNRIDEFGVTEPLITAQGEDRILVQLPGIQESERAKELIRRTARLEFKLVSEEMSAEELYTLVQEVETEGEFSLKEMASYRAYLEKLNEALKGKLSPNTSVAFLKEDQVENLTDGAIPMLLEEDTGLSGDMLEDASVGMGQYGEPVVNYKFGIDGGRIHAEVTGNNVGRLLAVVLDDVIKVAPQIQSQIFDRGQITLGSGNRQQMLEEAQMVSTTLRAGALPARLEQLEERTVGPTLGLDHIQKGKKATIWALILVLIFLIIYYRFFGLIADISLIFNIGFLGAILTSFGATLTLPGVAGVILTMGMAVDANIIIFERIREEFSKGANLKLAVSEGFNRAFSAILDANITTAIVCFILMYFGTGPIKGFAVTLFCGILTSVFTAVFVSRTLLNTSIHRFKIKSF